MFYCYEVIFWSQNMYQYVYTILNFKIMSF
jgi:hypothetical protein